MDFVMSCRPECLSGRGKPAVSSHASPVTPHPAPYQSAASEPLSNAGLLHSFTEFRDRYEERIYSMDIAFSSKLKEVEQRLTLSFESKLDIMLAEVAQIRCGATSSLSLADQVQAMESFTNASGNCRREHVSPAQAELRAQQHVEPLRKELESLQEKLSAQEKFLTEETKSSRLELLKQQIELASQKSELVNQELALEQARQDLHIQGQDLRENLDKRASIKTNIEPVNEAIDHINVSLRAFSNLVPADPRVQVFDGKWYRVVDEVLIGEISAGVLSWSEDFQQQPCVLIFTGDHSHISMHFNGKVHTGVVETEHVTNQMFIVWSFGEEWCKRGINKHNKSEVKRATSKVWSAIWRQSLPFREQLEGYPNTYAKRARMCGALLLMLFIFGWFVFQFTKMFAPERFTNIERETRYWSDDIEPLPFLALDWVKKPAHTTLNAELVTFATDTITHQSTRTKQPIAMRTCDFMQQQRTIKGAMCLPEDIGIVGTYGDEMYQYLRIDVVLATADAGWANKTQQERQTLQHEYGAELALVYRRRDTLYASVIQSQLYSFTLGHDAKTIEEIFFDRIQVTNGTILGLVEVMGMDDTLLDDITYTNLNFGYTRFETLDCQFDVDASCVVMSFYLRSSLVSSIELYHRYNLMDIMGDIGSLYTSFAACISTVLLMILFCPREVLKCTPWKSKSHSRRRRSKRSIEVAADATYNASATSSQ